MRIELTADLAAPREAVWASIARPGSWTGLIHGLTRFDHAGGPAAGLGARYRMRMRVGSADVGGLIEMVEWDEGGEIAWTSVLGIGQRGRWRLRDAGPGATRVTLRFAYQSPGLLGWVADRVAAPVVRRNLDAGLDELRRRAAKEAARPRRRRRRPAAHTTTTTTR
ncbi:MAG: Polyketide cyclase / dehydrase and lipid transport [Chloroflexi bacterium]|nr:Polyketide cyclase / dehydrase and lipid transport [Chloroflexota bacterium]